MTREHWHLDKRVPIAVIATIVFQSFAALWWAATINSRVFFIEQQSNRMVNVAPRIAVIESTQKSILDELRFVRRIIVKGAE